MKKEKIILIIILFLFMISPAYALENKAAGYLKLTEINTSNISTLPESFYVASKGSDGCNVTVLYDNLSHSINYIKNADEFGELYIDGLYPITECKISMEVSIDRDDARSQFYFYTPTLYLMLQRDDLSNYKIYSQWTDNSGTLQTSSFTIPAKFIKSNKIRISIQNYESNRTNVVKYDERIYIVTPYRTVSGRSLPYSILYPPTLYGEAYVPSGSLTFHIYNLTQEIPRDIITPYSTKSIGFGLDYPRRKYDQVGTAHMLDNGQVGTVWADVKYMDNDTVAFTKSLLKAGWELGIHFSEPLDALNITDAYAIIDNETAVITATYGKIPTSWCSLHNSDNVTHARYAYEHYGMYWRNGISGVSWISNVGNICNRTYDWWDLSQNHGAIFPTFTHQTDIMPAIEYSIDSDKFRLFSDNYASRKIKMCGFTEYYKKGIAQNETYINISELNSTSVTFTANTNGYPCNVNVLSGPSSKVYRNGSEIPSEPVDSGVTFLIQNKAKYVVISSIMPPFFTTSPETGKDLLSESMFTFIESCMLVIIVSVLFIYYIRLKID